MIKLGIKCCLLLCLMVALSCNSSGNNNEDKFIQINFDSSHTMTHKEFSFTGGVSVSDSGYACAAVTWEGRLNKRNYYGFAVGKDDFYLILYFPKEGNLIGAPSFQLEEAKEDTAPASGEYTAVMRYGDAIYKNPQGPITFTIESTVVSTNETPPGNAENTKITMTPITFSEKISNGSPSTVSFIVTPSPMILKPY